MRHLTFLSDFGVEDEWVAVCRGLIWRAVPDAVINDISHEIPPFDVRKGAFVLHAAVAYCAVGVHMAVVDPGVGGERKAIVLRAARGDLLVGPDNGLLIPAAETLGGIARAYELEVGKDASPTFHARDVFAPTAARLLLEEDEGIVGLPIDPKLLHPAPWNEASPIPGGVASEVIDVDRFGTVRLNISASLAMKARMENSLSLTFGDVQLNAPFARTFGDVPRGTLLFFIDSSGYLAIAVNGGSAADRLGLKSGDRVEARLD